MLASGVDAYFQNAKKFFAGKGIELWALPFNRSGTNIIEEIRSIVKLRKFIVKRKPDVVISYTSKPVIYTGLAIRGLSDVRHFPMITGLGYAFSDELSFKRVIVNRIARFLYRESFKSACSIIFQNLDDRRIFIGLKVISEDSRFCRVYGSGIDSEKFMKADLPEEPVFLMLARLIEQKGVHQYVAAAKLLKQKYPGARFLLAGALDENPGSLTSDQLVSFVEEGFVEYLGYLEDVVPAIKECRFYVLPSFYREGVPRSIIEAMSMGRPIITTNSPGCRDTVEVDCNGYIVEPRSTQSLALALEKCISLSDEKVEGMALHSLDMVRKQFDSKVVNQAILEEIGRFL